MSYLAPNLKHRVEIRQGLQEPNEYGGYDRTYRTLKTIWCEVMTTNLSTDFIEAIRGEQVNEVATHNFRVRYSAVRFLGQSFTGGFSGAFNTGADINMLKSDYFLFLQDGTGNVNAGRLFRIRGIKRDERFKEFVKIRAEEIEEQGTGWPD